LSPAVLILITQMNALGSDHVHLSVSLPACLPLTHVSRHHHEQILHSTSYIKKLP